MLTGTYSFSEIRADVYPDGIWKKRDFYESSETFRLEGARVFHDRWQAGASLPVVRRSRAEEASSGLGDIAGTVGYEYLPDWDYHPWRPRGLGYVQVVAPTGRAIQDSDTQYQLDSRGRGFWSLGLGTLLTKVFGTWDVFTNFEGHRSFARAGREPGWGANLAAGAGYNLADARLGSSLTWTHEDGVDTEDSHGAAERFATFAVSASYLYSEEWAATLVYADQTLFGDPSNTRLGQAVSLMLQRRWSR